MDRLNQIQGKISVHENRFDQMRKQHPLCRTQVQNLLFDEKYSKMMQECFDVIIKNRHIFEHGDIEDNTKQQERKKAAQMFIAYHRLRPFNAQKYLQDPHAMSIATTALYSFDPGQSVKSFIPFLLYGKTISNFGNKNSPYHRQLFDRALTLKDIGCFGLTEFGHGSNAKGIQTQATFDKSTQEFIMNMPTKTAMKFWIGAASQLADKAIIWAQLILDGEKYGPHPFVVPVRDPNTLDLLPGVTIGDCGDKNGVNNIDNGYIILDNVRIPKKNALDAISGVNQNNQFWSLVEHPEKRFGMYMNPLSLGRALVSINTVLSCSSAIAIAIRYTSQRRQFTGPKQTEEKIILEYPLTKYRLMPLLATAFVFAFGGINIVKLYDKHMNELVDPKNKIVNEMHATSAVAKAKSSWFSIQAITQCRQLLGGHGYSSYSRLGRLFHDNDINTTWEGDNHMLLQQTTKYILKSYSKIQRNKMFDASMLNFLKEEINIPEQITRDNLLDISFLTMILKSRISTMANQTMGFMFKLKSENKSEMDIWNYAQPYYGKKLALVFGDLYYMETVQKKLSEMSPALKQVTEQCIRLWALNTFERDRWGNMEVRKIMQSIIVELCEWMTPRANSLIDTLAPPSEIIGSPFADENGEGMRKYLNLLFSGKETFRRVDWFTDILKEKKLNEAAK